MNATFRSAIVLGVLLLFAACGEHDRTPATIPPPGSDTLFSVPSQYKNSLLKFSDIDGDGWRDALLVVHHSSHITREQSDSLLVFRFDPSTARHALVGTYADIGLYDVTVVEHRSVNQPIIVALLYGGGNDAVTYGKVLLVWRNNQLDNIAEAPWGDPRLVDVDSLLVLEIHQTFSGMLPHALAVEYADSLVVVGTSSPPYRELLERRLARYLQMLDSLWDTPASSSMLQWDDITSKIISCINLESKRRGTAAAQSLYHRLRNRWYKRLPTQYRQLLDDFAAGLGDEFSFIR
ncbi:MAG: hypothetical protein N2663_00960 [Chlorobi bacterium]|nr:hypothetical protein [Chlorobiota bacterium]